MREYQKLSKLEYVMSKHAQFLQVNYVESSKCKRATNVALQKQSRRENEFLEETLLPSTHVSGRNQRYANYVFSQTHSALLNKSPLGAGW